MNKIINNRLLLSISSGLLLSLAWREHFTGLIILVALIPLLHLSRISKDKKSSPSSVFSLVFPGFLIFNVFTFSWLGNASVAGAAMAILAHSILLSLVFWIYYLISNKTGQFTSKLSLVSLWLAYEYLCLNIDIISPWLISGNVFGKEPILIQWYEYTGVGGGSLWIIFANIIIYNAISYNYRALVSRSRIVAAISIILVPVLLSLIILRRDFETDKTGTFVIIQPNIDPYSEKFDSESFSKQFSSMLTEAAESITQDVEWVILPETAIDDPFREIGDSENDYLNQAQEFLKANQSVNLMFGATTLAVPGQSIAISKEYQLYNTAVHIAYGHNPDYYHKSKLVPGIERSVSFLPGFLERIVLPDLGGSMSGYGTQEYRQVFKHFKGGSTLAPIICYESAYGEFIGEYVNKGADILAIITNDGWWDKTSGYKQHYWFASIRAIENRRPVVRSANTGISCIIDTKGRTIRSTNWWEPAILTGSVSTTKYITLYTKYGDYIYRFFSLTGFILVILAFVAAPIRKLRYAG